MTYLADHARAIRAVADAFATESGKCRDKGAGTILAAASIALNGAADELDAEVAASRVDHACTIDHAALPASKRCPACGAPRG